MARLLVVLALFATQAHGDPDCEFVAAGGMAAEPGMFIPGVTLANSVPTGAVSAVVAGSMAPEAGAFCNGCSFMGQGTEIPVAGSFYPPVTPGLPPASQIVQIGDVAPGPGLFCPGGSGELIPASTAEENPFDGLGFGLKPGEAVPLAPPAPAISSLAQQGAAIPPTQFVPQEQPAINITAICQQALAMGILTANLNDFNLTYLSNITAVLDLPSLQITPTLQAVLMNLDLTHFNFTRFVVSQMNEPAEGAALDADDLVAANLTVFCSNDPTLAGSRASLGIPSVVNFTTLDVAHMDLNLTDLAVKRNASTPPPAVKLFKERKAVAPQSSLIATSIGFVALFAFATFAITAVGRAMNKRQGAYQSVTRDEDDVLIRLEAPAE
jgi:hypothetical protein